MLTLQKAWLTMLFASKLLKNNMNEKQIYDDGYKAALTDVLDALGAYWCAMSGVGDNGASFKAAYENIVSDPVFRKYLSPEQIGFFKN